MFIEAKSKVVFIGDSITDCGRVQPVADGLFDPLGRGYVTMIDALLGATYPDRIIRCVNVGTSGNTVRDLKSRWQRDVIDLNPQWLSVMIGTNDVWRQFDSPRQTEQHVGPDEYRTTLTELLRRARPSLKGMILMTPFFIESNHADAMRKRMDEYGAIVHAVATEFGAILVDTQAAFDNALKHLYSGTLSWDRVHPNQTGHMILARAWLDAVKYQW